MRPICYECKNVINENAWMTYATIEDDGSEGTICYHVWFGSPECLGEEYTEEDTED